MVLQPVAVERDCLAFENVDGRLVARVHMRFRPAARRDGEQMHADTLGPDGLGSYAAEIGQPLLSVVSLVGTYKPTRGL
jgi:hypothetical protein